MDSKIIIAVDELPYDRMLWLARELKNRVYAFKVHSHYDDVGPRVIPELKSCGTPRVWVDFKLKDIPNTNMLRAAALAKHGADIITVHASGGIEPMLRMRDQAPEADIFAVTVLTTLSDEEVRIIHNRETEDAVKALAQLAMQGGADGIVCSPKEVAMLASMFELEALKLVTPGVRSPGESHHDQKRVGTPAQAIHDGADLLVIGRQVTLAKDPVAALEKIEQELLVPA